MISQYLNISISQYLNISISRRLILTATCIRKWLKYGVPRKLFKKYDFFAHSVCLGTLFSSVPTIGYAYTPPFPYKTGTIYEDKSAEVKKHSWYKYMAKHWGSEDAVFENVIPGCMIDTEGTLFWALSSPESLCGCYIYVGKITPDGGKSSDYFNSFKRIGGGYDYDGSPPALKNGGDDKYYPSHMMPVLSACVAHEESSSNSFCVVAVPAVTKYWNTGKADNEEYLFVIKIQKDMKELGYDAWKHSSHSNVTHESYFNEYTHKAFCRNVHTASFEPTTERLNIFWLNGTESNWPNGDLLICI